MDISQCRLKLRELLEEQTKLMEMFLNRMPLVKGSVYCVRGRCGKPSCRCHREVEHRHPGWLISRSHEGRIQTKSLRGVNRPEYQRLTGNYRRFRQARERWVKIHREQIALVNKIEQARTKDPLWREKR
jgi:hypothetical protein